MCKPADASGNRPPLTEDQIRAATIGEPKPLNSRVLLVDYDPRWPELFEREADSIRDLLGGAALRIEHTGSTSVPGLAAKPIIDMLLVVTDSADETAYVSPLEVAGYVLRIREPDWYEHRMFKGPDTDINLHVFSSDCPEIDRLLAFRDWLRNNAADRELYARTKRDLATKKWKHVQNYADAKTAVIEDILTRATSVGPDEAALQRLREHPAVWKMAEDAIVAGDLSTLESILRDYGDAIRKQRPQSWWNNTLAPSYDAGDAREIIARTHHFAMFENFVAFTQAIEDKSSPIARFEAAVDTIVSGDLTTLRRLLREDSDLVRARSVRVHHSTLLHYVGANGVEGFRQHTPPNAVAIAETLLDAGAEADAVADMYRGSTTLALVATSLHPKRAGLQQALIQLLLDRGATLDHPAVGGGRSLVHSCLANGRPEAAEYLASRGAALDFESASALGRLDVVQTYFGTDARPSVTKAQMESALVSASISDATPVVQFLLDRGVHVDTQAAGFSGVNAAATGGHADTVRLFLSRGASLETKNQYGGTSLSGALWGALNTPDSGDYVAVIGSLLAASARIEPGLTEWWKQKASSAPAYARILELLETHTHEP